MSEKSFASVLMLRPISPELVLFSDFWVSNIPQYFCFAFDLTCRRMESYHPEHLLVYYKFLKNLAYVVNFRYRFIARLPVLLQMSLSIDITVSQEPQCAMYCAVFLVGWWYWWFTTQFSRTRVLFFLLISGCGIYIKTFFVLDGITYRRIWVPKLCHFYGISLC